MVRRTVTTLRKEQVPLQIDHIVPRTRLGTNRLSNLTLACQKCNQAKGKQDVHEFLRNNPEVLDFILAEAKAPLRNTATINSMRWALYDRLRSLGLPIETGSGGRTKYNRTQRGLPKAHWIDAACIGESTPAVLNLEQVKPLLIQATGHGNRQICTTNKHGFPIRHRKRCKQFLGFKTGDIIRAVVPTGKYKGTHVGRVTIRHRPSFLLNGFDVNPKYCRLLQRADGYSYENLTRFLVV